MKKILFVCTGNTCRSPMAEGILKRLLKEKELSQNIQVQSVGIAVFEGGRAHPNALRAMADMSIDISQHKSKQITLELIESANLILTMTQGHKGQILMTTPQAKDKIYSLLEFIGQAELDISDPFGMSLEEYKKTAQQLEKSIEKALPKILEKILD